MPEGEGDGAAGEQVSRKDRRETPLYLCIGWIGHPTTMMKAVEG